MTREDNSQRPKRKNLNDRQDHAQARRNQGKSGEKPSGAIDITECQMSHMATLGKAKPQICSLRNNASQTQSH